MNTIYKHLVSAIANQQLCYQTFLQKHYQILLFNKRPALLWDICICPCYLKITIIDW